MEKLSFVKNGVLRLPPGFRFRPTDEELVVQYLKRKVLSFPLPASIIPELEIHKSDPWDLPGRFTLHTKKKCVRVPKHLIFFSNWCSKLMA